MIKITDTRIAKEIKEKKTPFFTYDGETNILYMFFTDDNVIKCIDIISGELVGRFDDFKEVIKGLLDQEEFVDIEIILKEAPQDD